MTSRMVSSSSTTRMDLVVASAVIVVEDSDELLRRTYGRRMADSRWRIVNGLCHQPFAIRHAQRPVERVMGLEPTISCLGSKRSTTELHPQRRPVAGNYS